VTYIELIVRHLEESGADQVLIALVEDYLEHDHPTNEPPWQSGHDAIVRKAIDYGNSKRFRLRRFQARFTAGQRQRFEQGCQRQQARFTARPAYQKSKASHDRTTQKARNAYLQVIEAGPLSKFTESCISIYHPFRLPSPQRISIRQKHFHY
jgi:hypothetical protein